MDRDSHLIWESVVNEMSQWQSPRLHLDNPDVGHAFGSLQADYNNLNIMAPGTDIDSKNKFIADHMLDMIDNGQMSDQSHLGILQQYAQHPEGRHGLQASLKMHLSDPHAIEQMGGQREGDWAKGGRMGAGQATSTPTNPPSVGPDFGFPDNRSEFPPGANLNQRSGPS